jgi:hypothetical protein
VFFFLAIASGIVIGVLLGWAFNPLNTANTGLDSLRIDYKTDTILMVSQLYQSEGDLSAALARLSTLGDANPSDLMQIAINYATQHDYALADITAMQNLADDIADLSPLSE